MQDLPDDVMVVLSDIWMRFSRQWRMEIMELMFLLAPKETMPMKDSMLGSCSKCK
jgi:hypothetical protein